MLEINPFAISCKTDIHFGAGTHRKLIGILPQDVQSVVLVKGVSDGASQPVKKILSEAGIPFATVVCEGEPTVGTVNEAWRATDATSVDCIVVCGGGSAIDTGKALLVAIAKGGPLDDDDFAINHTRTEGVCLIVLPTTAGTGSEVTSNAVLKAAQSDTKISLRGPALQPQTALVDPDLMRSAPKAVVLHSGLDALVQNIEAYISAYATPFTRALSGSAIASTASALRAVIETESSSAWTQLAWGSLCSGLSLANGGLGAAHGLAAVLGGAYPAPHGAVCGRLLAPVLHANMASPHCTPTIQRDIQMCQTAISDVFPPTRAADPLSGFEDWIAQNGLPRLGDWGVTDDAIRDLAALGAAASSTQKNPVRLEVDELAQILRDAS